MIVNFDEKAWFANGLLLTAPSKLERNFLITEETSYMKYEVPKCGKVSSIIGDSNIFLVHLSDYFYPGYGLIHVLYFYIWGERLPFYEKYFFKHIEILEVKFPYIVYMIPNKDGVNDFYAKRL
ncbi:unnamed protein product [Blepharisma stoltei]|uniref:Uncharacterized protein n=1 Tax=Blepharisma stoltei TaxID=1481888 RepID=A0AAU9K8C0_9CILI|nr:unnamed protein product [Blepharisma stoltei]